MVIALYIFKKEIKTNKVIMIKKNCLNSCSLSNQKKKIFFLKTSLNLKLKTIQKMHFLNYFFFSHFNAG